MVKPASEFVVYLVDTLQAVGPVTARRMFGGHGIFLDGLMFALVSDNNLYFKVDEISEADFKAADLEPFKYKKNGTDIKMSYYQAPADVFDSRDMMCEWGNRAYAAALRAAAQKSKSKNQ